jgi:hypothetical protein
MPGVEAVQHQNYLGREPGLTSVLARPREFGLRGR